MNKKLLVFAVSVVMCVHSTHGSQQEEKKRSAAVAELEHKIDADVVIQKTARACIKELVSQHITAPGVQSLIAAYAVVPHTMVERNKNENVKKDSRLHPDTFFTTDGRLLASMEQHIYDVQAAQYLRSLGGATHTLLCRKSDNKDILFQRGSAANDSQCYDLATVLATKEGFKIPKEGKVGAKSYFGFSDPTPAYAYQDQEATTIHALVRLFSPVSETQDMAVVDMQTGKQCKRWQQPDVRDLVLCNDGAHQYAACYNIKHNKQAIITLCDLNNPKDDGTAELCQVNCVKTKKNDWDHFAYDKSMASFVDNTGTLLLAVANKDCVELYDVQSQKQTCVLDAAGDVIMHCAAKTIGQQSFVVACMAHNAQHDSTRLVVWDMATKERVAQKDFSGKIIDMALAQDGTLVAHRQDKRAESERVVEHVVAAKITSKNERQDGKIEYIFELLLDKVVMSDQCTRKIWGGEVPFNPKRMLDNDTVEGTILEDRGATREWWSHLKLADTTAQDLVETEPAEKQ